MNGHGFRSKVDPNGVKSYVVPPGVLGGVSALTFDASGILYVADGGRLGGANKIWKVSSDGKMSSFVEYVPTPTGLAFDSLGNLYVASYGNNQVYKFGPDGSEKGVVASNVGNPYGLAVDRQDNLYIAGFGPNSTQSVYKLTPAGQLSTFAYFGGYAGAPSPHSLVFDVNDNLWVTCYNATKIAKVATNGDVQYYPGGLTLDDAVNGIALDSKGNMFVAVNGGRTTSYPAVLKFSGLAAPGLRLAADSDGDGVPDSLDKCPNTTPGAVVNASGCEVIQCFTPDQVNAAIQNAVAQKDAIIAQKDALIAEKDQTIAALNYDVNKLTEAITLKDEVIASLNIKIATLNGNITTLNATIATKDQVIADLNAIILTMFTKEQMNQAVLDAKAAAQQADIALLTSNLSIVFGTIGYVLPGTTVVEQITNLTHAIGSLPKGQIDKLKQLLTP